MTLHRDSSAVVTGASSGIGAALTLALTKRGVRVYAVARREEKLAELSRQSGCETIVLDLRDRAQVYAKLASIHTDILINNAGLGRGMSGLLDCAPQDIDTTIETNVNALYHVIKAVVPGMAQRQQGHIVNIGSVAGLYPISSAVYGGSKGAVHLLTQNLRLELLGSGLRVTEICPGRVDTEFFSVAFDDPAQRDKMTQSGIKHLTAGDVADAVVYALEAPAHVNIGRIEISPVDQSFGGIAISRSKASDTPRS